MGGTHAFLGFDVSSAERIAQRVLLESLRDFTWEND